MKRIVLVIVALLVADLPCCGDGISEFLESYAKEHKFSGTILIQKDGSVAYRKSFGLASHAFDISNSSQTRYKIASITKTFTAVLILQLHEEGILDIGDPIGKHLPGYSGEGAGIVRIHNLLTHTSGIRNIESYPTARFRNPWHDAYQKPFNIEQIIDRFCSGELVSKPGTKYDYNNGDYILLGKIIENVCGKPFETVLRERILYPLGLRDTGMAAHGKIIEHLAETYVWDDSSQELQNDRPAYIENWFAAGAMYSTSTDLLAFSNALFEKKLLKEYNTLNLMLDPFLQNYACGVWIRRVDRIEGRHPVMQRYGRIRGANAVWFRFLNSDLTIIVLSNSNTTDMATLAYAISKRL